MNPGLMMLLLDLPLGATPASVGRMEDVSEQYHFPSELMFFFFSTISIWGIPTVFRLMDRNRALEFWFHIATCCCLICKTRSLSV